MDNNLLRFYSVEDCDFCNCQGMIFILDEFENEEKKDCPVCLGKGAIHKYK